MSVARERALTPIFMEFSSLVSLVEMSVARERALTLFATIYFDLYFPFVEMSVARERALTRFGFNLGPFVSAPGRNERCP